MRGNKMKATDVILRGETKQVSSAELVSLVLGRHNVGEAPGEEIDLSFSLGTRAVIPTLK
jgi:hypothetical protein